MNPIDVGEVSKCNARFRWTISDFSNFCENVCVGESLKSPMFAITNGAGIGYDCQLRLCPKGVLQLCSDYLFISLMNRGANGFKAVVSCSILDSKNNVIRSGRTYEQILNAFVGSVSLPSFVKRNFILNKANGVLDNDKLTILCDVILDTRTEKSIEQRETQKEEQQCAEEEETRRLKEFQSLIDDKEFSDVSFIVERKTLRAHKCILVKRSCVFAAMFRTDMKEKQRSTVEVRDISHGVFVEMLRYVYSGKVNGIDTVAEKLAAAAEKYSLDGLKAMCGRSLSKNLCVENVLQRLKLADRYRMDILKTKAIEFILSHASSVVNKPEFQLLPYNVVCEVCRAMSNNM